MVLATMLYSVSMGQRSKGEPVDGLKLLSWGAPHFLVLHRDVGRAPGHGQEFQPLYTPQIQASPFGRQHVGRCSWMYHPAIEIGVEGPTLGSILSGRSFQIQDVFVVSREYVTLSETGPSCSSRP